MGRGRKKGGGAGAIEPKPTGAGAPPLPEEELIPGGPPAPAAQPAAATPDEKARSIFGNDIFERGIPRQLEAGGMADAWNGTPSSALRAALVDSPVAQGISLMYGLPTAREYYDIPSPERAPLTRNQVHSLADTIGEADIITNGGTYADLLDDLGVAGLPQATSARLRVGEDTKPMVTRVSEMARGERDFPVGNLTPNQRARVAALLDTLGGLSLTRERAWETMILTQGQTTPKGEVMGAAVKRVLAEARRISNEINRTMGITDAPTASGLPKRGTPGALAYQALITVAGQDHNWRALNHKAPLYANRGLENINND